MTTHLTEQDAKAAESGARATERFQEKARAAAAGASQERVSTLATEVLTAVHDEVPRLRSFLFVDDLVEVTALLAARTHEVDPFALVAGAGAPLGGRRSDWGAVLARFREQHGATLTRRSTIAFAAPSNLGSSRRVDVPAFARISPCLVNPVLSSRRSINVPRLARSSP